MGYGVLFVVGMLTSLHCIAMCGGITCPSVSYKFDGSTESFPLNPATGQYWEGYILYGNRGIAGALGWLSVSRWPRALWQLYREFL